MGLVLLALVVLGASADSFSHFKAAKSEQTQAEAVVIEENATAQAPSVKQEATTKHEVSTEHEASTNHEALPEQSLTDVTDAQTKI